TRFSVCIFSQRGTIMNPIHNVAARMSAIVIFSVAVFQSAPARAAWVAEAAMPTATFSAAEASYNGVNYVAGGYVANVGSLDTLQAYDSIANSWQTLASMPAGISYSDGAGFLNGKLYIPGGQTTGVNTQNLFVYDPVSNTWSSKANMPIANSGGTAGVIN